MTDENTTATKRLRDALADCEAVGIPRKRCHATINEVYGDPKLLIDPTRHSRLACALKADNGLATELVSFIREREAW
jgi:hypothetical protein